MRRQSRKLRHGCQNVFYGPLVLERNECCCVCKLRAAFPTLVIVCRLVFFWISALSLSCCYCSVAACMSIESSGPDSQLRWCPFTLQDNSKWGFPGGTSGKEPASQFWRHETRVSSLGWEAPLEKGMQSTQVFLLGESHGLRSSSTGYSPQGCRESDVTEATSHTCIALKKICLPAVQHLGLTCSGRYQKLHHSPHRTSRLAGRLFPRK